jgi:hypothetical protein
MVKKLRKIQGKVKCPECGKSCKTGGLVNHIRLKHKLKVEKKLILASGGQIVPEILNNFSEKLTNDIVERLSVKEPDKIFTAPELKEIESKVYLLQTELYHDKDLTKSEKWILQDQIYRLTSILNKEHYQNRQW